MLDLKKSNFENTVLVGVTNSSQDEFKLNEYLEELEFLTRTAGGKVVKKFKQKVVNTNPKYFIDPANIQAAKPKIEANDRSISPIVTTKTRGMTRKIIIGRVVITA